MHRFYVSSEVLQPETVTLGGPVAHQLARVLRARPGEQITLFDGSGAEVKVELVRVAPQQVVGRRLQITWPERESRIRMVLCQALLREAKFDWVLQKATELGVYAIVPLYTSRTLVSQPGKPNTARQDRWQRIVIEASEQSGRVCVPEIRPAQTLTEACDDNEQTLIAAVAATAQPLADIVAVWRDAPPDEIRIAIGPEGGFSAEEIAQAAAAGARPIALGPRILRAETAGIAALAALSFALGEWNRVPASDSR